MSMMKCPECGTEISDKAVACPDCGYPIADAATESEPQPTPAAGAATPAPEMSGSKVPRKKMSRKAIITTIAVVAVAIAIVAVAAVVPSIQRSAAKAGYVGTWTLSGGSIEGIDITPEVVGSLKEANNLVEFRVSDEGRWSTESGDAVIDGIWVLDGGEATFYVGDEEKAGSEADVKVEDGELSFTLTNKTTLLFTKTSPDSPDI